MRGMARSVRIEYPGAVYHVMCRGDRKESIFDSDRDRCTDPFSHSESRKIKKLFICTD
jgi:hypothetical protein